MTPKEKAEKLFTKYLGYVHRSYDNEQVWHYAKQCAIIAVDEILIIMNEEYLSGAKKIEYWEQVKNEIQNL